jgi:hypothetical protein
MPRYAHAEFALFPQRRELLARISGTGARFAGGRAQPDTGAMMRTAAPMIAWTSTGPKRSLPVEGATLRHASGRA